MASGMQMRPEGLLLDAPLDFAVAWRRKSCECLLLMLMMYCGPRLGTLIIPTRSASQALALCATLMCDPRRGAHRWRDKAKKDTFFSFFFFNPLLK